MTPNIPSARITLTCPLFGADFDPQDSSILVVGGGGGEGRSGVGNRITLLDTSIPNKITEAVDIELSRDEDSVTSLGASRSSDDSTIVFVGINSSQAEQKRNNNQHLRSFRINKPSHEDVKPMRLTTTDHQDLKKIAPLSRVSLFRVEDAESGTNMYQRVLRLSPLGKDAKSSRIGAIATRFAPSGEIIFFAATPNLTTSDVIARIRLDSGEEAEDVDIAALGSGDFRAAYTNGTGVFTCQVSLKPNTAPDIRRVYSLPLPAKEKSKSSLRALRFLSPTTLLLLMNVASRGGAELLLLQLLNPGSGSMSKIIHRKKLHSSMKTGLGLDVCRLGQNLEGEQQTIVAVSGSDSSIEILTIDHGRQGETHGKLRHYAILRNVHPFSMTKICFSTFLPPSHASPDTDPPSVKLASVSMGNTVVIHTFPLTPFLLHGKAPRYVLSQPGRSDAWDITYFGIIALFSLLFAGILLQAFAEIRGLTPPYIGSANWLPQSVRKAIAQPYMFDTPQSVGSLNSVGLKQQSELKRAESDSQPLHDLLRARHDGASVVTVSNTDAGSARSIIVRDMGTHILVEMADSASLDIYAGAVPWESLEEEQRATWIQRLIDSGHWVADESESILRGVLFKEYAELVGSLVRNALD